jgi:hypothetical protein
MVWKKVSIITDTGDTAIAIGPEILSVSRSTDIPAFFSAWFMNRLERGYLRWVNPFNNRESFVSLHNVKLIMFWSKNPKPLIPYFPILDQKNIDYCIQFTLNNYENEKLEPGVPDLESRINTFKEISSKIGKSRIFWRYDPLILTDKIPVELLMEKIKDVGEQISTFTSRLTISFLVNYEKVNRNLAKAGVNTIPFTSKNISLIANGLQKLGNRWGIPVYSCAEEIDLGMYGILHGACIDPMHLIRTFPRNASIYQLAELNPLELSIPGLELPVRYKKDPGQRKNCCCMVSKDIGRYDTCSHLCIYCYANMSDIKVLENCSKISMKKDILI